MLDQIKGDTEELLKLAFENYYLLSSSARKGILDGSCSPPPGPNEFPPTALVAGVHLFEAMCDVFHPRDVEWLTDRFKLAAKGRWQRLAMLCDEGNQQVRRCWRFFEGAGGRWSAALLQNGAGTAACGCWWQQ